MPGQPIGTLAYEFGGLSYGQFAAVRLECWA
jgi:hypothetical protein